MAVTYNTILEMSNEDLVKALAGDYYKPIPIDIDSADAMKEAGKRLAEITNQYAYLQVLLAEVKAVTRTLSINKEKREEYKDMVGKRDTIQAFVDILDQSYKGLSREISTRMAALKEINMSSSL